MLILVLCLLVTLNIRFFVIPLVSLILSSIVFFYYDPNSYHLISEPHLPHVQTLITIIGGLFLIQGFTSVPPPVAPVIHEIKKAEHHVEKKVVEEKKSEKK